MDELAVWATRGAGALILVACGGGNFTAADSGVPHDGAPDSTVDGGVPPEGSPGDGSQAEGSPPDAIALDAPPACEGGSTGDHLMTIATGQSHPWGIDVVDGFAVFWTNHGTETAADGSVMRFDLSCGGGMRTVAGSLPGPAFIVANLLDVTWANTGTATNGHNDGLIERCAVGGGGCSQLMPSQPWATGVAITILGVLFTSQNGTMLADFALSSITTVIGAGSANQFAVAGSDTVVYVAALGDAPTFNSNGHFYKGTPQTTGSLTDITPLVASKRPRGVAFFGTTAFFVTELDGGFWTVDGANVAKERVNGLPSPFAVAVDLLHVYVSCQGIPLDAGTGFEPNTGSIVRMNLDGTGMTVIASNEGTPRGIALDLTHVFWVNSDSGEVRAAPK